MSLFETLTINLIRFWLKPWSLLHPSLGKNNRARQYSLSFHWSISGFYCLLFPYMAYLKDSPWAFFIWFQFWSPLLSSNSPRKKEKKKTPTQLKRLVLIVASGIYLNVCASCFLICFVCVMCNIYKWHSFLNELDIPNERLPFFYIRKMSGAQWESILEPLD